jgi:hypothetical protein
MIIVKRSRDIYMDRKEHKLNILQSIISRMAANSSNCKLWAVTLLSAIMVLFLSTDDINLNVNKIILLIPILPFMFLDAFYLGLERHFVKEYNNEFKNEEVSNIPVITKSKGLKRIISTMKALLSFSVWGFYLILLLTVSIVLGITGCK